MRAIATVLSAVNGRRPALAGAALALVLQLLACGQSADEEPSVPGAIRTTPEEDGAAAAEPDAPAEPDLPPPDQRSPRGDLARFVGVYGDPEQQERMPRNVFVDRTCDGRLRFGAMWGDVAPWVMKPLSDTEFEQAVLQPYETEPIRLEFHVGAGGRAEGLTHTLGEETRLRRLGDLPEAFDDPDCPG